MAERLLEQGVTIPAPPAPVNPISRETAHAIYEHFNGGESTPVNPRVTRLQEALLAHAPALVRDLAEAAKGQYGMIRFDYLKNGRPEHVYLLPVEVVRALTPGHAGER